jgi:glycosyltransferase involved in cell wall biosynthesis
MIERVCMLVLNDLTHDTRVLKSARTLDQAGYDVTVWALGHPDLADSETRDGFKVKRWSPRFANRAWHPPGLAYAERAFAVARRLWREQSDIYHAHDTNALLPCYLAARRNGSHLVYGAHELFVTKKGQDWRASLRKGASRLTERLLIRRADAVITVNQPISQELNRIYGVNPVVVMNCQEYQPTARSEVLRQELGIPAEYRVAIYAGSWTGERGLEQLVASAQYLDRVVIVLMGSDRLQGSLQRLARDLQVEDRVRFRKPVPPQDIHRYVASADVGVMPTQATTLSYYYGSGNKLFHYITAGIPALVSNHPEKRRIVETYGVGTVFDETDPKDIARRINAVVNDRATYKQMHENALRAARDELNWAHQAKNLLKVYQSLGQAER